MKHLNVGGKTEIL